MLSDTLNTRSYKNDVEMKYLKTGQMLKLSDRRRNQQDYESDQRFDANVWYLTVFDICFIFSTETIW